MDFEHQTETSVPVNWRAAFRNGVFAAGRIAIEYCVADQLARQAIGLSLGELAPGGMGGSFVAILATDAALKYMRDRVVAITEKCKILFGPELPGSATARRKDDVWIVSGFPGGRTDLMDDACFRKFEARLAQEGKCLAKVTKGADGSVTTMWYRAGKLHRDDGPAVSVSGDRQILKEIWVRDGEPRNPPSAQPPEAPWRESNVGT